MFGVARVRAVCGLLVILASCSGSSNDTIWQNPQATLEIAFPHGWGPEERLPLMYQGQQLPDGSARFTRRAGGNIPQRLLSAGIYPLPIPPEAGPVALNEIHQYFTTRLSSEYERIGVTLRGKSWILPYGYRFTHTGDPVSQVIVYFSDLKGHIYIMEITGHRKDEKLVLKESQAIMDRIVLK